MILWMHVFVLHHPIWCNLPEYKHWPLKTTLCFCSPSPTPRSAVMSHMWLVLWCPIRDTFWLWLTSLECEAHGRSCATVKPWRSWSSRSSLRLLCQVSSAPHTGQYRFYNFVDSTCKLMWCHLLCSPAGAFWDPSQDLPEPRPMDAWDRISDWRVQAQTEGAEKSFPGRHRKNVWWEITRAKAVRETQHLTRNTSRSFKLTIM